MGTEEESSKGTNALGGVQIGDDATIRKSLYEDGFGELCKLKQTAMVRDYQS